MEDSAIICYNSKISECLPSAAVGYDSKLFYLSLEPCLLIEIRNADFLFENWSIAINGNGGPILQKICITDFNFSISKYGSKDR